jgi:hypothetical protein
MECKGSDGDSDRTASSEEYINPYAEDHFTPYIPAVEGEEDAPMELSDDESSHGSQGSDSLGPLDGKEGEDGEGQLCGEQALKGTACGAQGGQSERVACTGARSLPSSFLTTYLPFLRTHITLHTLRTLAYTRIH